MKKFLLAVAAMALSLNAFAENYVLGEAIPKGNLPEGEHKVIFQVVTKNSYGFLHSMAVPGDAEGKVYFGYKDASKTIDSEFDGSYVYTINVDADKNFTIMNSEGGYAPKEGIAVSNIKASYFSTTPVEDAGSYRLDDVITTASLSDFAMITLNSTTLLDVHLDEEWTYFATGAAGRADAGGAGRSAVAFKIYYAEEVEAPDFAQVTNESVTADIVDGAVIALQCLDTAGGSFWYFDGAKVKTETLQFSNLFKVVAVEGGFNLQQCSTGKYVGGDTGNGVVVKLVDEQSSAAVFTAAVASPASWTTTAEGVVTGVNTIRFTTTNSRFLNTSEKVNLPKYSTGTGGFSVWYVYKFNEKGISDLAKTYLTEQQTAAIKEDTPGFFAPGGAMATAVEAIVAPYITEERTLSVDDVATALQVVNEAYTTVVDTTAFKGPFNGVYTIANKDHIGGGSRGYIAYVENDNNYVVSSGSSNYTVPAVTDDASKWAFVVMNGKTFIFNVAAKQFILPDGTSGDSVEGTEEITIGGNANTAWVLSKTSAQDIAMTMAKAGVGSVEISSLINNVRYYMSISNSYVGGVTCYYEANGGGLPFVFERVGDLSEDLKSEMLTLSPTTGIEEIAVEQNVKSGIYDLQGRRLNAPVKGINIINGKKVLVK